MKYYLIALALLVICVIYFIVTYNEFMKLKNEIKEAYSTMDVYLVQRSELIPNLVATVKGYTKHEAETFERIVNARSKAIASGNNTEKMAAENEITSSIARLFALAESYPELKANTNFLSLQTDLKALEAEVASSRKYYNGVVREFNTMIDSIPSNLVAKIMKLEKGSLYEVANQELRKNVKVEF